MLVIAFGPLVELVEFKRFDLHLYFGFLTFSGSFFDNLPEFYLRKYGQFVYIVYCVLGDRVRLYSTGFVVVLGWCSFVVDGQLHFSIARFGDS